ncbi:MAG: hypothetical protein LV480_01945 [Methylacidiphilales bacterium]|nr:hypothetical protein [Candidatus Methylacidiphilales bacterium]
MNETPQVTGTANLPPESANPRLAPPKWACTVNDETIPLPRRVVEVAIIRAQANVSAKSTLVRDYDSPNDQVLRDDESVDLSEGNVFYTIDACDAAPQERGDGPAKLAFFVNDRAEETINPEQTGQTIRELFGLTGDVSLLRDLESPHDDVVQAGDAAPFTKGCVFITRRHHVMLVITVNHKKFTEAEGVKRLMTGRQIASLVSDTPDKTEVFRLGEGEPKAVGLDQEIEIQCGMQFRVIRNNVAGGFEPSRVERELERLREGGARADFILQPAASVVYRDIPTRPGYSHIQRTDVLVMVPGGYPGQPLDGAHLPEGSPLLGRVAGSPQGIVLIEGRRWQLVSYHPHCGGGGPPWNKDRHGFHTYFDEILCWVQRANN